MNKKKALPVTLLALLYKKALAYIWIVIGIVVLIVGLYIAYELNKFIKRVLQDDPPTQTNNVTRVWLTKSNYDGWVYDNSPLASGSSLSETLTLESEVAAPASFNMQYMLTGINSNGPVGWQSCGTNLPGGVVFGNSVVIDPQNYSFTITEYGQVISVRCIDGVYSSELVDENMSTYRVVVERSSDLQVWQPVFTNEACGVYTVQDYMDTNAPPAQGFYRLKIAPNPN